MKAVTLFLQVHFSSFFAVDENHGCVQDLGAEQLVQLVKTVKGAGAIKTSDDGSTFQSIVVTRKWRITLILGHSHLSWFL